MKLLYLGTKGCGLLGAPCRDYHDRVLLWVFGCLTLPMLLAWVNFRNSLWRSSKLFDTLNFWKNFHYISICPDTLVKISLPSVDKTLHFALNCAMSLAIDTKALKERSKSSTLFWNLISKREHRFSELKSHWFAAPHSLSHLIGSLEKKQWH